MLRPVQAAGLTVSSVHTCHHRPELEDLIWIIHYRHYTYKHCLAGLDTHTSHLTPHISYLTPHTSHLTPHTSHLTSHTSHLAPHTSHLTPHTVGNYYLQISSEIYPRNLAQIYRRSCEEEHPDDSYDTGTALVREGRSVRIMISTNYNGVPALSLTEHKK